MSWTAIAFMALIDLVYPRPNEALKWKKAVLSHGLRLLETLPCRSSIIMVDMTVLLYPGFPIKH